MAEITTRAECLLDHDDILHQILSNSDLKTFLTVRQTCRNKRDTFDNLPQHIYRHLVLNSARIPDSVIPVAGADGQADWRATAHRFLSPPVFRESTQVVRCTVSAEMKKPANPDEGQWMKQHGYFSGLATGVREYAEVGYVVDYRNWSVRRVQRRGGLEHSDSAEIATYFDPSMAEIHLHNERSHCQVDMARGEESGTICFGYETLEGEGSEDEEDSVGDCSRGFQLTRNARSVEELMLVRQTSSCNELYGLNWETETCECLVNDLGLDFDDKVQSACPNGFLLYRNQRSGWTALNPYTGLRYTHSGVDFAVRYADSRLVVYSNANGQFLIDCVDMVHQPLEGWPLNRQMIGVQFFAESRSFHVCSFPELLNSAVPKKLNTRWVSYLRKCVAENDRGKSKKREQLDRYRRDVIEPEPAARKYTPPPSFATVGLARRDSFIHEPFSQRPCQFLGLEDVSGGSERLKRRGNGVETESSKRIKKLFETPKMESRNGAALFGYAGDGAEDDLENAPVTATFTKPATAPAPVQVKTPKTSGTVKLVSAAPETHSAIVANGLVADSAGTATATATSPVAYRDSSTQTVALDSCNSSQRDSHDSHDSQSPPPAVKEVLLVAEHIEAEAAISRLGDLGCRYLDKSQYTRHYELQQYIAQVMPGYFASIVDKLIPPNDGYVCAKRDSRSRPVPSSPPFIPSEPEVPLSDKWAADETVETIDLTHL